jgi:Cu/Ag efflux protein CusF
MRKLVISLAAAGLLCAVSAASADDEMKIKGTIKAVDAATNSVTLDNGSVYKLPSALNAGSFKVGEQIKLKMKGNEIKIDNDD